MNSQNSRDLTQSHQVRPSLRRKPPANRDVNEAAKNIIMMDLVTLQAEAAAGMYKKPIELLAREVHYEPLPIEARMVVIAAWQRGGLPKGDIERMIPEKGATQEHTPAAL